MLFGVKMLIFICLTLLLCTYSMMPRVASRKSVLLMSSLSSSSTPIAVVGFAGGVAETIAYRLTALGYPVSVVLDDAPVSPLVKKSVSYYFGEIDKSLESNSVKGASLASLLQGRIVIAVDDTVPDDDTKVDPLAGQLFQKLEKILPTTVRALICSSSVLAEDNKKSLTKIFENYGSNIFKKFVETNSIPLSVVRYGKLTGGIPGAEPLPFLGFPLAEPELHPSYVLQAVVLSTGEKAFASTELCTRDSLAEAVTKLIVKDKVRLGQLNFQVTSIEGPLPTEENWNGLLAKISGGENVELCRVQFAEITKPQALTNWVADTWFPQALIDADAATILSGARPVKASKLSNGNIRIIWENILPDLSVKRVGEVEIRIDATGSTPSVSAVRLAESILPGEDQLMEKLVEGINKNVFKKQFCVAKQ